MKTIPDYVAREFRDREHFSEVYHEEMGVMETRGWRLGVRKVEKESLELRRAAVRHIFASGVPYGSNFYHALQFRDLIDALRRDFPEKVLTRQRVYSHILSHVSYTPKEAGIVDFFDKRVLIKDVPKAIKYLAIMEGAISIWEGA